MERHKLGKKTQPSGKYPGNPAGRSNAPANNSSTRLRILAGIGIAAILIAGTAIPAQLKQHGNSAGQNKKTEGATVPVPGNLTAANLSKEYVYGPGGRLVATEEPNAISPTLRSFPGSGGTGTVDVSVGAGTNWFASTTTFNWIMITSGASGTGNGTVAYTVSQNAGTSIRQGTITITIAAVAQTFTVYQGKDFVDVPLNNAYYAYIGKLVARGVTVGCDATHYCTNDLVTREQMSAFILRALGDPSPPTPATQRFTDVPPSNIFYNFIDEMAVRKITVGCGGTSYCPTDTVTHDSMSAFIMRALAIFSPPAPATQLFPDVPSSNVFYDFIDVYAHRGIWNGGAEDWTGHPEALPACTVPNFCPGKHVSRAQMAKILVTAFNL